MKDYKALQNGSDIRGVAMEIAGEKPVNLTNEAAADLARAFALWLARKTGKELGDISIAIGRDSRITGPALMESCATALSQMGVRVYICGLATTPAMFMATVFANVGAEGSIMLTASHLPYERNGLKFFTREGGLDSPDIKALIEIAEADREWEKAASPGEIAPCRLMEHYAAHLRGLICSDLNKKEEDKPLSDLHVAVDAGNGASGFYVDKVLKPLGADCSGSQFLEPDGMFPNHPPNPENEEAMQSICAAVKASGADLGIIFDTDGDRSSAVDENANEIARNRIVALAAVIAGEGYPQTTIVTDSITSTQLGEFLTKELGLKHFRYRRGYRHVINKAVELDSQGTDCRLTIETSGHAAMKENYFLDDGAYLATKIVIKAAQLKKEGKGISSLIAKLKDPLESKEYRLRLSTDDFAGYAQSVLEFVESSVQSGMVEGWNLELPNYEGVRVNVPGGWFLMRKSLHDPVIPLNIESDIEGGVEQTFLQLRNLLSGYDKLTL